MEDIKDSDFVILSHISIINTIVLFEYHVLIFANLCVFVIFLSFSTSKQVQGKWCYMERYTSYQ